MVCPSLTIVGRPEAEVRESKDRVRTAWLDANFEYPVRRVTTHLAPADFPSDSARLDLPIALGLLAASGQIQAQRLDDDEFAGEHMLTAELRPIRGALARALAQRRMPDPARTLVLPEAGAREASVVPGGGAAQHGALIVRDLRQPRPR